MITLECNYSKKLGLPGYSSHQFAITLRTEITDLNQVQIETARLYKLLQEGVDTSIKEIGYPLRTPFSAFWAPHTRNRPVAWPRVAENMQKLALDGTPGF